MLIVKATDDGQIADDGCNHVDNVFSSRSVSIRMSNINECCVERTLLLLKSESVRQK